MSNSTASYADRIGKFKNGNTLIQGWGDYDPGNPLITKAALTAFIGEVEAANTDVVSKEEDMGQEQDDRALLCFTLYDDSDEAGIINPDCAQQRIIGVHSYLESLFPDGSKKIDIVERIIRRIRPRYPSARKAKSFKMLPEEEITVNKVVDGGKASNTLNTTIGWREADIGTAFTEVPPKTDFTTPTASGTIEVKNFGTTTNGQVRLTVISEETLNTSPSERTFASIPGFLTEVITLVSKFTSSQYDPPDSNLTVTEMEGLRDQIEAANAAVSSALDDYGTGNRGRKNLYDGDDQMADRISMIKSYLASFSGKKKSEHFIEFSQAIKGR